MTEQLRPDFVDIRVTPPWIPGQQFSAHALYNGLNFYAHGGTRQGVIDAIVKQIQDDISPDIVTIQVRKPE